MIEIRDYHPDDRAALRALVLALHEAMRPLDADLAPGEAVVDEYFSYILRTCESTQGHIWVAEDEDGLVGYAILFGQLVPEEPDEHAAAFSFLSELFVLPGHRGSGLGGALLERAEARARELGAYKVELKVLSANADAIRFYDRRGYTDRIRVMAKRLGPPRR